MKRLSVIDASGAPTKYDPLTDGLILLRYLFGVAGDGLTKSAIAAGADRTETVAIESYLAALRPGLDIDGNGKADALTDGLLIIRYMFGLRGSSLLTSVVAANATRKTALEIEAYLQGLMP